MSHSFLDGPMSPLPADGPSHVPSAARSERGRPIRRFALGSAIVFAGLIGVSSFLLLDSVDLISTQPIADSGGWLVLLLLASIGAGVAFALSIVAAVYCRPRPMAMLTLALSAALPAAALVAGAYLGLAAFQAHTLADLQDVGDDVQVVSGLLDAWQIEAAPLRGLLNAVARIAN
jgi:hypothetical protein